QRAADDGDGRGDWHQQPPRQAHRSETGLRHCREGHRADSYERLTMVWLPMAMPALRRTPAAARLGRALAAALAVVVAAVAAVEAVSAAPSTGAVQRRYGVRAATETSSNWAGYSAVTPDGAPASTFTSATGTWRQPVATCSLESAGSASAVWVGLGGYDL